MKKRIPLIFTLSIIAIGFASVGASCPPSTTATGVTVTTDIAGEVICVLQHDTLPPAQIVVACVGLALTDVENILAADPSTTKWQGDAGIGASLKK